MAAAADPGRGHHLIDVQVIDPAGDKGAHELGEGGVMPADLAHAGEASQAPAHLQFVGDQDADQRVLASLAHGLGRRDGAKDDVGRVAGVLLPIDVVIVQRAHQQAVHQRRVGRVGLGARCR